MATYRLDLRTTGMLPNSAHFPILLLAASNTTERPGLEKAMRSAVEADLVVVTPARTMQLTSKGRCVLQEISAKLGHIARKAHDLFVNHAEFSGHLAYPGRDIALLVASLTTGIGIHLTPQKVIDAALRDGYILHNGEPYKNSFLMPTATGVASLQRFAAIVSASLVTTL